MALEYRVVVPCKARAPSGNVVNIPPGTCTVVGDEPGHPAVRLIHKAGEFEITHAEFQRLKAIGAVERQTPR